MLSSNVHCASAVWAVIVRITANSTAATRPTLVSVPAARFKIERSFNLFIEVMVYYLADPVCMLEPEQVAEDDGGRPHVITAIAIA